MKRSVAFAVVSGMAILGLAADVAPETALMHRWSFGDWTDSVGGATAQKGGTYASLYGGRVHLGYGSSAHGTGYVELGANLLDTAAATIELWARHDGVAKWSRIFDYGVDDEHYFQMPWTYDTNISKDRVGAKNGGSAGADAEDTMAPYAIGADYYIAATFEKDGDGTRVKWQRRDAATGEEQKSGALTIPGGMWSFVDPVLYLGHSQFPADCDAMAAYDEVRIWRGALSDATLAASAKAGPDATITMADGAPQFAAAEPPPPPAQREAMPEGGYRIMTYNIQYCYDENSTIVEDRTAARIIAENPDFCLLNEIRDSNAHPEATMLAKLTGMHKTHNHNTILSKEAPLNVESYDLPYASYGDRGLVVCEFSNVVVAVTHLDVGAAAFEARTNSIDIIRAALAKYAGGGKPVILGGDWNARPSSTEVAMMKEFMTIISPLSGARTYHNHDATGGYIIDYIAVDTAHAADIYTADSFVVDDYVTSDHNPVIAEVYLRPQASELGWVDERFLSAGRTGTWKGAVRWDAAAWAAELFGENVFEPLAPSGGNVVEFEVTAAFDTLPDELATPDASAQGALWLGANGNFQIWSPEGWLDAAADGVAPATGAIPSPFSTRAHSSRLPSMAKHRSRSQWKKRTFHASDSAATGRCVRSSGGSRIWKSRSSRKTKMSR